MQQLVRRGPPANAGRDATGTSHPGFEVPAARRMRLAAAALGGLLATSFAAGAAGLTATHGTRSHDLALGLARDARGDLYVGTVFQGRFDTAPFGASPPCPLQGTSDSWVLALAGDGSPRWARCIAGSGRTELRDVVVARDGTIAAAGYFLGDVRIDGQPPRAALAGADAFVAAFDREGGARWLASFGGKGADTVYALAPDRDGLVVVGDFEYGLPVARAGEAVRVLPNAGRRDAFVVRIDAAGAIRGAVAIGGPGEDRAVAVATRDDGGVVVLLSFTEEISVGDARYRAHGGADALLVELGADGAPLRAVHVGHAGPDRFDVLALAPDGRAWIGGTFTGDVALDVAGTPHRLRSAGSSDIVLVALARGWGRAEVRRVGGDAADTLARLAPGNDEGVYATGASAGRFALGDARFETGGPRGWIARLDAGGKVRAATLLDADGITQPTALVVRGRGTVTTVGMFEKAMRGGGGESIPSRGKTDVFVATRVVE